MQILIYLQSLDVCVIYVSIKCNKMKNYYLKRVLGTECNVMLTIYVEL